MSNKKWTEHVASDLSKAFCHNDKSLIQVSRHIAVCSEPLRDGLLSFASHVQDARDGLIDPRCEECETDHTSYCDLVFSDDEIKIDIEVTIIGFRKAYQHEVEAYKASIYEKRQAHLSHLKDQLQRLNESIGKLEEEP